MEKGDCFVVITSRFERALAMLKKRLESRLLPQPCDPLSPLCKDGDTRDKKRREDARCSAIGQCYVRGLVCCRMLGCAACACWPFRL